MGRSLFSFTKNLKEILETNIHKTANELYLENQASFDFVKTKEAPTTKKQNNKNYKCVQIRLLKSKFRIIRSIARILYNRTL